MMWGKKKDSDHGTTQFSPPESIVNVACRSTLSFFSASICFESSFSSLLASPSPCDTLTRKTQDRCEFLQSLVK